jgi:hypothetical protein
MCPWCANPHASNWSPLLCLTHSAQYEGMSPEQAYQRRRFSR